MNDRRNSQPNDVLSFGPFSLFAAERLLKRADEAIPLGGRALAILIALTEQAGEVVTHKELISRVWPDVTVEDANLRVHIAALRKALGDGRDGARYVSNVAGRGYCFVAPVAHSSAKQTVPVIGTTATERVQKLPPRPARMVGRDDTVRSLAEQLQLSRFVSIVGPGGVGKTTVAISVAHMLIDGFHDAVFFIDLAALTDPQLVPTAVASALGFMVQTKDPLVSLLAFIGDKKILLVLDNCEHVIGVAAALAERVVGEAPQAHILATSREALRVEGEHVHLLYSLDCPPEDAGLTAVEALRYPAAQLFMERAAASGYGAALSDIDAPIVAWSCRRLDGVALAIELAASRVGSLGIRGTAELLDNRFGLLWHGRRTALSRHETLNAMLDWSYSLLSEREKVVLCRLSVFVGDFTRQAAGSVASETEVDDADEADVFDAVASLVAKSLISTTVINESTYYRLLDTTRAYAATKLAERGEADRFARRHAIFYSKFLEHDEIIQSTFGEHDLSVYAPHIGNVRAALEWALSDRGDVAVGIELATWAAPLFIGLSLLEECRGWCERALAALDDASRGTRQEMILQEALAQSSMYTRGYSDQVRVAIERGLALAEALEDRLRQLHLLFGLNLFLTGLGDIRGALAVAEQGGVIAQAAKHPAGTVWVEWRLGLAHHLLGNQAAAQLHCERGFALAIELGTFNANFFGFDYGIGALVGLARILWLRGFSDQALRIVQKAIDEAASRDHPVPICISLVYASMFSLCTGDLPRTGDFIEQLIAYAGRYSLERYRAVGIALKGELAITRDEPEAGLDLLRSALETLRAQQYNVLITLFIGALAEGLRKTGQFEQALFTINGAIARATNSGVESDFPELLRIKSQVLAAQHDRESAMNCLTKALAVARAQSALAWELRSTTVLARLLSESGQRDQARHALALVYDRFTEGFDTADLKLARALLEDLR
ncbi:winged helix-turn-helix domain-containing protein [Bradyrhizobium sp. Ash2021]|uniref:ATP-binding protein n=1 Tax=Bradyrhizobium sp. Ash2021 TaxID=2954771 RepID=UPI002816426A|nr:winged helix-turn-helix domain-containing protein [Bradyrhizobium sp. Ash2021]WMT74524.1 winged helix-turn-helix domain-containing protein [Bradyrhizobium sp. Ash2021]